MQNNNFSEGYKKILLESEKNIKKIWFKNLKEEDLILEILRTAEGWVKEIFTIYWINEKLIIEILQLSPFNARIKNRKWNYTWMDKWLKDTILMSFKIATNYKKSEASLEDFILAMISKKWWFTKLLDYVGIVPSDIEGHFSELNNMWVIDGLHPKIEWWNNNSNAIAEFMNALTWWMFFWDDSGNPFAINKAEEDKIKEKEKSKSKTPALDYFCIDLTKKALDWKIENIIGREDEIERLIAILNRKTKNNPVLVWEPWVGKTAVVEGLAKRIVDWNVPFSMKGKKILALDMSSLIAWTKYRWEFEERIKQIIDEASKVENEAIIFIDELHTIIWAWWAEWSLDASNILKPAMWRGQIRIIWATTLNEYQKYIEKDSALERRFGKINTPEPDIQTTIEILEGLKENFEEYHNLIITTEAVKEAVSLAGRYITDRFFPDKAIDLIDEACSMKSMKYNPKEKETTTIKEKISKLSKEIDNAVSAQQYEKATTMKKKLALLEKELYDKKTKFSIPKSKRLKVVPFDLQRILSISTGIPTHDLNSWEIDRIKQLPKDLKWEIIGQDEAINSITSSIMRSKAGITNPNRPLASYLFLGPTWVWKTELVKVLTDKFYADKDALIKIDMSEYPDKTAINKLIWSSAWYVGYEEWGYLTEKVRKNPYSVILFDEIEKWWIEVYNLLLQILEDWILTDNKWRKVNFKNTIIVMTSNIGQEEFTEKAEKIGFNISESEEEKVMKDYKIAKENIIASLSDYFPQEFINRIDKIIVFSPLDKNVIKKIVSLQLKKLETRLKEKDIKLIYNARILTEITKKVYNPEFWAREVRRFITDSIEDPIAEKIIMWKTKIEEINLKIEKGEVVVS